jgi:hypothetical protein
VGAAVSQVSNCGTGGDGFVRILTTGGVSPFVYTLTPTGGAPVTQRNSLFNNLAPGAYSISVTDTAGCTSDSTVNLAQATQIKVRAALSQVSSCGTGSDGFITVKQSGGVWPFKYTLTGVAV